ncbi:hypothetical protein T265_06395 [Opisthorchis viverrini]|uniref:Uncharacterized protein n=1 Tax=Opisthorchis viverrini TaxID=6198 RepID=A0A074ZSK8_OPIVI|nr:hypothetical protein T265_06395 [Opisthorchis viverrini]KER26350.1 hypothetical protein T265_06395 [Opisthorchis viverrini]
MKKNRSAVTPFRCLAAMLPEGCTRAGILPGCPSLDRGSREAEVGFEPRTFRSVNSRSNHLRHLAPPPRNKERYCNISLRISCILLIIDNTTSVFNIDASLPYNHDLFEGIIVKKRVEVDREAKRLKLTTMLTRCLYLQTLTQTAQGGSRGPHPGRRVASTAPKRFVISFISLCPVKNRPPLCLRHSELGMENSTLFGKQWFGIRNTCPNQRSFWYWTHSSTELLVEQPKTRFLATSLRQSWVKRAHQSGCSPILILKSVNDIRMN